MSFRLDALAQRLLDHQRARSSLPDNDKLGIVRVDVASVEIVVQLVITEWGQAVPISQKLTRGHRLHINHPPLTVAILNHLSHFLAPPSAIAVCYIFIRLSSTDFVAPRKSIKTR